MHQFAYVVDDGCIFFFSSFVLRVYFFCHLVNFLSLVYEACFLVEEYISYLDCMLFLVFQDITDLYSTQLLKSTLKK